jgi:hypothetical protein
VLGRALQRDLHQELAPVHQKVRHLELVPALQTCHRLVPVLGLQILQEPLLGTIQTCHRLVPVLGHQTSPRELVVWPQNLRIHQVLVQALQNLLVQAPLPEPQSHRIPLVQAPGPQILLGREPEIQNLQIRQVLERVLQIHLVLVPVLQRDHQLGPALALAIQSLQIQLPLVAHQFLPHGYLVGNLPFVIPQRIYFHT